MNIKVGSGNYWILDSRIVLLDDEDSKFFLEFEEKTGFKFSLEILFERDESNSQTIERKIDGENITYICKNFLESGTGTTEPILLATIQGKNIFIHFWSRLKGQLPDVKQVREIEYTVFQEK